MFSRWEFLVRGVVQGVGYRYIVRYLAVTHHLTGYVENLPDGGVRIIAEGREEDLEKFMEEIRIDRPPIKVEHIEVKKGKPTRRYRTFKIRTASLKEELVEGFGTGATYLKTILDKQDQMLEKQDKMLERQDLMLEKQERMLEKQDLTLEKQDRMLEKQDQMLEKQDMMVEKQDETLGELRGIRSDLKTLMEERLKRLEEDVAKIKAKLGIT